MIGGRPPDELKGGFSWRKSKSWANSLRKFAVRSRITSILVRERLGDEPLRGIMRPMLSGTLVELIVGGGGSTAATHPLHLIDASNDISGAQVRVTYGTVHGNADPGMSLGDYPVFILPVSGAGYIYFELVVDWAGDFISLAIDSDTAVPSDSVTGTGTSTEYTFNRSIGTFAVAAGPPITTAVADALTGSQEFQLCGTSGLFGVI